MEVDNQNLDKVKLEQVDKVVKAKPQESVKNKPKLKIWVILVLVVLVIVGAGIVAWKMIKSRDTVIFGAATDIPEKMILDRSTATSPPEENIT